MKSFALLTILLTFCLASPECGKHGTAPLPPEKATQARRAIVTYLECEECTKDEVEAVVKLGKTAVPTLIATLREGPPRTNLEVYRRNLAASYRELKEYERTHPNVKVPGSEQQYIESYLENYDKLYRVRAATALGTIGGAEVKEALEDVLRLPLSKDVSEAVKASLGKIK